MLSAFGVEHGQISKVMSPKQFGAVKNAYKLGREKGMGDVWAGGEGLPKNPSNAKPRKNASDVSRGAFNRGRMRGAMRESQGRPSNYMRSY